MKISYNEACALKCSSLYKDLYLCEEAGFDYIEIRLDMLKDWLKTYSIYDLKNFFDTHRLKPHAINAIYLKPNMLKNGEIDFEDPTIKDFVFACEVGQYINSGHIVIVPPFDPSGIYRGEAERAELECSGILSKLSVIAYKYDIKLCFEIVGLKKSYIRNIRSAINVMNKVPKDNIGLVLDIYNLYLYERLNNFEDIKLISPEKIFAVHLTGADKVSDEELGQDNRCFPCECHVNIEGFLKALKISGYDGMVSVETFRPEYWKKTPEWIIKNGYIALSNILNKYKCL